MACAIEDAGFEIRDSINWVYGSGFPKSRNLSGDWEGWGTTLKPAHEPIVVARKPLAGTVAANVLAHGTGALNIDGCRVPTTDRFGGGPKGSSGFVGGYERQGWVAGNERGRWPANLVLTHDADCDDECTPACPIAILDEQSGRTRDGVAVKRNLPPEGRPQVAPTSWSKPERQAPDVTYGGEGGASRFFTVTGWDPVADVVPFRYVPKPAKRERNAGPVANFHPTVKPLALMRWLVRLVTPPGGVVLDPFAGSGTTLVAAVLERFNAVGIELTDDYLPIIRGRVAWAEG